MLSYTFYVILTSHGFVVGISMFLTNPVQVDFQRYPHIPFKCRNRTKVKIGYIEEANICSSRFRLQPYIGFSISEMACL